MTTLTAVTTHKTEQPAIQSMFSTLAEKARSWRTKRQAVQALQGLSPAMLRDIGIDATEIKSVIYSQPEGRRMTHDRF